jgi:hypothetical protein
MKADRHPIDQALGDMTCDLEDLDNEIGNARFMFKRRNSATDEAKRDRRDKIRRHAQILAELLAQEESDELQAGLGPDLDALALWNSIRDQLVTLKDDDGRWRAVPPQKIFEAVGGYDEWVKIKIYHDARAAFVRMFSQIAENAGSTPRRRKGPTHETTLILEIARIFDARVKAHEREHNAPPAGASKIDFVAAVAAYCGVDATPASIRRTLERYCDK